jgi:hypothetical protein
MPLSKIQIEGLKQVLKCVTWHWTAGTYSQVFDDYHFCITYDGKLAHVKQTRSLREKGAHCWRRNTGNIGISLCAMAKGYPVEDHQVEVAAKLTAELCFLFGLDPNGHYVAPVIDKDGNTTGLTFQAQVLADHKYYAAKDGYSALRWDIGDVEPIMRRKTLWYYSKLKSGEHKLEFTANLT